MKPLSIIITIIVILVLVALGYRVVTRSGSQTNVNINATTTDQTPSGGGLAVRPQFKLVSSAFEASTTIPMQYTCEGANTQPPLSWDNAPLDTQSYALTVYDPDVPKQVLKQGFFDHWVVFNIPATTTSMTASSTAGILGNNGSGKAAYTGPCPPTNYEPKQHRYIFTLYALDNLLGLKKGATRADVEKAVAGHVLASTTLMGLYQKSK